MYATDAPFCSKLGLGYLALDHPDGSRSVSWMMNRPGWVVEGDRFNHVFREPPITGTGDRGGNQGGGGRL